MSRLTLVTGGSRSGKSRYALEQALAYERRAFIATGVAFDAESVVAKPDGIVLRNGSVLSGVLHALDKRALRFRSTALGPLELSLSDVGVLYFDGPPDTLNWEAPPKEQVRVVLRTGAARTGTPFAVSSGRILLRTADGLEKFAFSDARYVVFGACRAQTQTLLRNGDRIGFPMQWQGREFVVQINAKQKVTLNVDALKAARF